MLLNFRLADYSPNHQPDKSPSEVSTNYDFSPPLRSFLKPFGALVTGNAV
jgi:hypothetical protein